MLHISGIDEDSMEPYGVPESVALLRNLAEKAPDIEELIWIILSNGRDMGRIIEQAGI